MITRDFVLGDIVCVSRHKHQLVILLASVHVYVQHMYIRFWDFLESRLGHDSRLEHYSCGIIMWDRQIMHMT